MRRPLWFMSVTSLTSSCIVYRYTAVLLEMMMSVLQEVKGLTKKLYFVILLVVTMQNWLNVYTVYLF